MAYFRHCVVAVIILFLLAVALVCSAQSSADKSLTIVLNDGNEKTFSVADISRIDFQKDKVLVNHGGKQESIPTASIVRMEFDSGGSKGVPLGRNHFIGRWEFGQGVGTRNFFVTLERDGKAHKSIGSPNGTWTVVDGEARITWDDGWKDVIRKVGSRHEKCAYEPGRSLTEEPSNVSYAKSREPV